jgi:LysR family transcriptional regulator, low CO2-responsive transcriptional regulator
VNFKQLEIFVAIATTGSFSRGAEAAFITQSTASQHMAALEELCGVRLLDRTGRGAIPTEAGKIMLFQAQQVLRSLKETEQALLRFRQADGVELFVGGSTIPGTYLLPQAVALLRRSHPGISVTVEIGDSRQVLAQLSQEKIEVGIVGAIADAAEFTSEALGYDEILLVVGQGHPWSGCRMIELEKLKREPLIMREKGSGTSDAVICALGGRGIKQEELQVCATISSSEAIKQAVLSGCGAAFISEMAVRGELMRGELVSLKLADLSLSRTFSRVHRKGRTLSPAAELFSVMLRQVCGQVYGIPSP